MPPHSFVILLPLQFLLLRQLEGPHSIILVLALPQTLFLVKDSHPLDYDRIQALPRHSRHLHRFYPFKVVNQLLKVYFSTA